MPKRKPHPYALPMEKRKRLSKKRRAELFLLRKGRCHRCRQKIEAGTRWIAEHFIALQNGGTNAFPDNWGLTCVACFHPKNRADAKTAAKGRRLRAREDKHRRALAEKFIAVDVRGALAEGPAMPEAHQFLKAKNHKRKWPKRPFPDKRLRAQWWGK